METLKDFYRYLLDRKKYWLVPLIITLLIIGAISILAVESAIAPFIYSIF